MDNMAKFTKPGTAKSRKGAPPKLEETNHKADYNLAKPVSTELVNMNFKVSAELSKRFRQVALDENLKLVELFTRCFEEYKK